MIGADDVRFGLTVCSGIFKRVLEELCMQSLSARMTYTVYTIRVKIRYQFICFAHAPSDRRKNGISRTASNGHPIPLARMRQSEQTFIRFEQ